jgi:hypothetical protein
MKMLLSTFCTLLTALLLAPLAAVSSRHWKTPCRKLPTLE